MRAFKEHSIQELPPGYELVRFDAVTSLVLPSAAAGTSRVELLRRQDALDEARLKEQQARQDVQKEAALAEGRAKAELAPAEAAKHQNAFGDEAAPGSTG